MRSGLNARTGAQRLWAVHGFAVSNRVPVLCCLCSVTGATSAFISVRCRAPETTRLCRADVASVATEAACGRTQQSPVDMSDHGEMEEDDNQATDVGFEEDDLMQTQIAFEDHDEGQLARVTLTCVAEAPGAKVPAACHAADRHVVLPGDE